MNGAFRFVVGLMSAVAVLAFAACSYGSSPAAIADLPAARQASQLNVLYRFVKNADGRRPLDVSPIDGAFYGTATQGGTGKNMTLEFLPNVAITSLLGFTGYGMSMFNTKYWPRQMTIANRSQLHLVLKFYFTSAENRAQTHVLAFAPIFQGV
jgi:dihydroorotase-like cyclic amidohydrolase